METIPLTDLNRMVLAIEQEVQAHIKELRVETIQLYNSLKARYIEAGVRVADEARRQRAQDAAERRARAEGALRNALRKRVEAARGSKIQEVMAGAADALRRYPLAPLLLEQCVGRVEASTLQDCYVFCAERDAGSVRAFFTEKHREVSFEVRKLPEAALGGVILLAKTGREICDNSFQTRLKIFQERHLKDVAKILFPAMR